MTGGHGSSVASASTRVARMIVSLTGRGMWPWLVWLVAFYSVWLALNVGAGYWSETVAHWPVALSMALGSYVAGSTPMGGGTVGFPVLVLLFDLPASLGRNFALAIQSIGMTSASIFILCRRSPVEWRTLPYCVAGAAAGLLIGTFVVVPLMPDVYVKLVFACVWVSFGVLTLAKNSELCGLTAVPQLSTVVAKNTGLVVGLAGGVTTALTGVGIDMMLYTVLVLLFRMDLKVAVPTSVIIMAASSLMGVALHLWLGDISREVFGSWLAASPVVILGAPLGALLVSIIPRKRTLYFVAVLCVLQFVWTLFEIRPSTPEWLFVAASLAIAMVGFVVLYRAGRQRATQLPPVPSLLLVPRDA